MAVITVAIAATWEYYQLPQSLATGVSHNSEAFVISPLVVAAIETRRRSSCSITTPP